tara:strand:- start:2005 stop:2445 length:441 start_codon:yes stop_codon:yes gene_type:complete
MPGYKKDVAKIIVKKLKKGGKVELTPDAKKIPSELEKASQMHKGQAKRLRKLGFKHGGEAHDKKKMSYGHGGDVKYGHGGEAEKKKMKHGGEAKPDFLDIDKDGDKKESMKKASKDRKKKKMKHGGEMKYGHGGMVKKIVKKLKDK